MGWQECGWLLTYCAGCSWFTPAADLFINSLGTGATVRIKLPLYAYRHTCSHRPPRKQRSTSMPRIERAYIKYGVPMPKDLSEIGIYHLGRRLILHDYLIYYIGCPTSQSTVPGTASSQPSSLRTHSSKSLPNSSLSQHKNKTAACPFNIHRDVPRIYGANQTFQRLFIRFESRGSRPLTTQTVS